jgi:hypothetical protein
MKPNQQQKQQLQEYLRKGLKYRETYEEVYDHILTVLESKPVGIPFAGTVNAIIREDFGGSNNLWVVENNCRKGVEKAMIRKYVNYLKSFFKISSLIYIIPLLCIFYVSFYIVFVPFSLVGILFIMAGLPIIFIPIRYFKVGYIWRDTRRSLRDSIFNKIAYLPLRLFMAGSIFFLAISNQVKLSSFKGIDPFILTAGTALILMHTLAVIKLNKDEFKMSLIQ